MVREGGCQGLTTINGALIELYRHKTWATLRLIEHCEGLADEHLDATIPGTYGTIRETLRHMVDSDEGYYRLLTGERLSEPLPDGPAPLGELAERIRRLGPRWEAAAADAEVPTREVKTSDGWRLPGSVPMTQAVHHAGDHRTHILTILGSRGLEVPELDLWGYAESAGQMVLDPSRTFSAAVRTARGDLMIALADPTVAARTVNKFVYIAQNNFYDGLTFHLVESGLLVQGGDPRDTRTGEPAHPQATKSSTSAWPRGSVGMASSPEGAIGSELFIALKDAAFPEAGGAFSRLGHVSSGMEVVDQIRAGDTIVSLEIRVL